MCDACGYRWIPCGDQYCRGYRVSIDPPTIGGCKECDEEHGGVQDHVANWWPEAHRALARELDVLKMERVVERVTNGDPAVPPPPRSFPPRS
jgi:hypothetical protein